MCIYALYNLQQGSAHSKALRRKSLNLDQPGASNSHAYISSLGLFWYLKYYAKIRR